MSQPASTDDLDREHAAFAATADRALAASQAQVRALELELEEARAALAASREELQAIHRAGHIPATSGHHLSRLLMKAGRRTRTAGW